MKLSGIPKKEIVEFNEKPEKVVSEYTCKKQREEQIKSNIEKNSVQLRDYTMETIFLGGPLHREQKLMDSFTLDGLKDYSFYMNKFYTCYTCKNEINLLFMLRKTSNMYRNLFLGILCRKCDMVFYDTIQLKYDGE